MQYAEFGLPVDSFISIDDFNKTREMTKHNRSISSYYERMIYETGVLTYRGRADRVRWCGHSYVADYFPKQKACHVKKVFYCHDKFCPFCQKGLSQARQQKYKPLIDQLSADHTLCHMVLTVKNPLRADFAKTIDTMYRKVKYFVRILSGDKKISGVDFTQYGYAGLLRATEVTLNIDTTLHPHFHCVLALKKGLQFPGKHKNQFSYNEYGEFERYFSDFEILIQKVWYLVYNGIKVTKESISELKQGYSCFCEPFDDGNFHEVFKYCLKGLVKGDEFNLDYEDFESIEIGLCGRHLIQGYGCFWQIKDSSKDTFVALEEEAEEKVNQALEYLLRLEVPVHDCFLLDDLMSKVQFGGVLCFSKFNIHKILARMRSDDLPCQAKKRE